MTIFVILVEDIELGGTAVYGSYRSAETARAAVARFRDTASVDYRDPAEYHVKTAAINADPNR